MKVSSKHWQGAHHIMAKSYNPCAVGQAEALDACIHPFAVHTEVVLYDRRLELQGRGQPQPQGM